MLAHPVIIILKAVNCRFCDSNHPGTTFETFAHLLDIIIRIVIIIFNDDYYPDDYIEKMSKCFERGAGMVGIAETTIYSLQYNNYRMSQHPCLLYTSPSP